jgi:hypothetical protein
MALIQLERYARAKMLNEGNERIDEDERQDDTWDPMQEVQFSDNVGAAGGAMEDGTGTEDRDDVDSGLPRKYRNKMKRYEHYKNKIPNDPPPRPARFEYEKENLMSAQAVVYAELLKICQKHNAGKGMYDDIQTWAIHWNQVNPNTFTEHSHANKWNCNKIIKFLKQVFPSHRLEPESVTVELHDKRQVWFLSLILLNQCAVFWNTRK